MPEHRSADGTARYDPNILFVLPISHVFVLSGVCVVSCKCTRITILHLASRYYIKVFEQAVALGSWTGRVHLTGRQWAETELNNSDWVRTSEYLIYPSWNLVHAERAGSKSWKYRLHE
jgi:hypothetical protein